MAISDYLGNLFGKTPRLPSPQGTQVGGRIAYPDKQGYISNVEHGFKKNPVVAACVGLYASTLNEPPLGIMRPDGTIDTNHPLSLLFRRPNKYMGQAEFWQVIWTYLGISGNCYVRKVRSELGNIVEMIPYSDAYVAPVLDDYGWVSGYVYRSNTLSQVWKSDDVIHLINPAYRDPLAMHMGISPIEVAWDKINTYNELQATMYSLVASNAVPSGILSAPGDIPSATVASLREQLKKRKNAQGRERTDPLVLGSGMSYTQMGLDATKLQANEMIQELEVAICGSFRIHPVVALTSAGLARSTYNNIQSAYQEYTTLTRVPFWNALEEQIEAGLYKEYPSIQVQFDLSEVQALQPDADALIYPVIATFEKNIVTQNETRKKLGYEPIDGGDQFYYQIAPEAAGILSIPDDNQTKAPYDEIDFTPPQGVQDEAQKGLDWRSEYGRGGTEVGIARARDLSNGVNISPDTARRMKSYFARHEVDKQGGGWSPDEEGFPSNGRIAWALWGGDAGQVWANKIVGQMDRIDEENKEGSLETKEAENRIIWKEEIALKAYTENKDVIDEYVEESLEAVDAFIMGAARQATAGLKSLFKEKPKLKLEELIKKFMRANEKQREKLFAQILDITMKSTDSSLSDIRSDFDEISSEQAKEVISRMKESGDTLQRDLNKLIDANQTLGTAALASLINDKFKQISAGRAATIARTIATAQASRVQNEATIKLNDRIPEKKDRFVHVWISMRDDDVRDSHEKLDGRWVEIGESFAKYQPGCGEGPGLGDDPAENCNCRCITRPVRFSFLGEMK